MPLELKYACPNSGIWHASVAIMEPLFVSISIRFVAGLISCQYFELQKIEVEDPLSKRIRFFRDPVCDQQYCTANQPTSI